MRGRVFGKAGVQLLLASLAAFRPLDGAACRSIVLARSGHRVSTMHRWPSELGGWGVGAAHVS